MEDRLNKAFKQHRAFMATMPVIIKNLSQAEIFLVERQKQLCNDLKQFSQQANFLALSQTKETEELLEQLSDE